MSTHLLALMSLSFAVAISIATILIAVTTNRISKRQMHLDLEWQKLSWCRDCLRAMPGVVNLGVHTSDEVTDVDFKLRHREPGPRSSP